MDQTLRDLQELFVKALPTLILLLLLHVFFRLFFLKPLEQVLAKRREVTQGAQEEARKSLALAEQKTREYEEAIRQARAEIYREQEENRTKARAQQDMVLMEARQQAQDMVAQAKQQLALEAQQAKAKLTADAEALANQITDRVLVRRPS